MCGITGYVNIDHQPIQNSRTILKMLRVQRHRGPDDSCIRVFSLKNGRSIELGTEKPHDVEGLFEGIIGFNRLSILDLSLQGRQPMVSTDGNVLLTLNGEIYNAFDLKPDLVKWGYRFKSSTDTEVALALYQKHGFEEMQNRLNGMFAIVVVDLLKKELHITRDRFGIKPLYYIYEKDFFAFSSEIKSFGFLDRFRFHLSEKKLDEYLLFRNTISDTLFKGIQTLNPGHYLRYRHDEGLVIKRYYDINNYNRTRSSTGTLEEYCTKLYHWLNNSVKRQLMSDVKLGCQLSGGIDSSLVAWLANNDSKKGNFETVSVVFEEPSFNEEKYIDKVAKNLGIISHKFLLKPNYYFENFERASWHLETPINHPNTIGIYRLSQLAKNYVTVLLSGEGADEVFGGYSRFGDIAFPFRIRKIIHEIKKSARDPLGFLEYFNQESRVVMATAFMTPQLARRLYCGFSKKRATHERLSTYGTLTGSMFDRHVKYEILSHLPDLLNRQDKMSMAHSIENRVPFLDNEIVEKSFAIPEKHLMRKISMGKFNNQKYLLKKLAEKIFGRNFAFRNKMGFGIPIRNFFTEKKFYEYLNDKILPGIRNRGIFNHRLISNFILTLDRLEYYKVEAVWIMVSFECWASQYLDNFKDFSANK